MSEANVRRKAGRPRKNPEEGMPRRNVSFRTSQSVYARIATEAAIQGLPVSDIIERRLEKTFETQDMFALAMTKSGASFIKAAAAIFEQAERKEGATIDQSPAAASAAWAGLARLMTIFFEESGAAARVPWRPGQGMMGANPVGEQIAEVAAMTVGLESRSMTRTILEMMEDGSLNPSDTMTSMDRIAERHKEAGREIKGT